MSTNDAHDSKANGHGLPEDSRQRLNRLREDVSALLDLTRAHQPEEETALMAEVRRDELAASLTALHEQIVQVLHGGPRSAQRGERNADAEAGIDDPIDRLVAHAEASGAAPPTQATPVKPYVAGVTLDQIDEMVLLLESLAAHGDVVTAADHAEFAPTTLSLRTICSSLNFDFFMQSSLVGKLYF